VSIFEELTALLTQLKIPVETGAFSGVPPDEYCVLTPITDDFTLFADNLPMVDVSEVRISLFSKRNYLQRKRQIVGAVLAADFTITDRRYIAHEDDTGYHHAAIDVAKYYQMEESDFHGNNRDG
jgi:hypothetical protein